MSRYIKISIKTKDGNEIILTETKGLSYFELLGLIKQFQLQLQLELEFDHIKKLK